MATALSPRFCGALLSSNIPMESLQTTQENLIHTFWGMFDYLCLTRQNAI